MVSKEVSVAGAEGPALMAAYDFVGEMRRFEGDITLECARGIYSGKSLMNVMASRLQAGERVKIVCRGRDEKEMLKRAAEIVGGIC